MGNLTTAFVFIMVMNVFMFLAQITTAELNPDGSIFYNDTGSLVKEFDAGGYVLNTDADSINKNLPESEQAVTASSDGNFITDSIKSIKNWFASKTVGLKYITHLFGGPYTMLRAMHLPDAFAFAIGTLWYGITFMVLVAFIMGRSGA